MENYGSFKSFDFIYADVLKIKITWKIVRVSKTSVLYVYIDYNVTLGKWLRPKAY